MYTLRWGATSEYRLQIGVFEGVGQFRPKIEVEGDVLQRRLAFFLRKKYTFRQEGSFCVFEPPSWRLGTTYAVHIRLIRKPACVFIIKTIGVPGTIAKLWLIIGQICTSDREHFTLTPSLWVIPCEYPDERYLLEV